MYGVAYPASSGGTSETLYVQAGDGGTDAMTKLVQYNVSGSWRARKWFFSFTLRKVDIQVN